MAPKGGTIVDISGAIARTTQAVRSIISGMKPSTWMGPGQPLAPMAPEGTQARAFDYPIGYNQQTKPRHDQPVTHHMLRQLSRHCDVLRTVIETRKDQVASMDWQIRPKADAAATSDDPRILDVQTFFQNPDKRRGDWDTWLRLVLEDMFVLDAVAIEKNRLRDGTLNRLRVLDGGTFVPKLDENGDTPEAPDVAYQQILKGIPAIDFSTDELIYLIRNPSTDHAFGYSPVEQVLTTINTALRRSASQLAYYTDGNLNSGVFWLPESWTTDQVKGFQTWWDELHSGNQAEQRKAKFLPGAKDSYQTIIQPPLKDEFDEWIARVVCFAFSIAPTPFIKQMNRATADTAHQAAIEEGLAPVLKWVKRLVDRIIVEEWGYLDLEFSWIDDREMDPQVAAEIQDIKLKNGTLTQNEARAFDGLDPYEDGIGDTPGLITATGFSPLPTKELLDAQLQASLTGHENAQQAGQEPTDEQEDQPPSDDKEGKAAKALAKKYTDPLARAAAKTARAAIHSRVKSVLDHAAHHVAAQIRGISILGKADDPDAEERRKARAGSIADELTLFELSDLKAIAGSLSDVYADSAAFALDDIGVTVDTGLFGQINTKAVDWASQHAADLVTQISDTTRDKLRVAITEALQTTDIHGAAGLIAESGAFSDTRALLIADTETAIANGQGALTGYKQAKAMGIKIKKQWLDDPLACPICVGNALDGPIDIDEPFSSGDDTTPGHVNCSCTSIAVIED